MSDFLKALANGHLLADGAMGSYLFELTGRLSEPNHVYEAFNLDRPDLVRRVHVEYLQAGARALTANTFGANAAYLAPLGENGRVAAINAAGIALARSAIDLFTAETGADPRGFFVLGSIGPVLPPGALLDAVRANYAPQVEALGAAKPDAILLETFDSLDQAIAIAELIAARPGPPPVVLQMTNDDGRAGWGAADLIERAEAAGVAVVGVNCLSPWDATAFLDEALQTEPVKSGRILLSAMPNAGGFRRIGQRFMNHVNPEFMGRLGREYVQKGVALVGGCCEVHPGHLREMSNYLRSSSPDAPTVSATAISRREPTGDDAKRENGPLSRKIIDGEFAVSVELLPPRGTPPRLTQSKIDFIAEIGRSGLVDAVDVTDSSRGIPLIPPGDFISLARSRLGLMDGAPDPVELIPHFSTRDVNLMGIQARLLGLYALGIHNVLFITGDPPKMSPTYPRSTAVFDLDSVALIRYTHEHLNAGIDFGGEPLGRQADPRTRFTIGSGFEPEALDQKRELEKLDAKIDGGVDYVFTQPAFRLEALGQLDGYRARVPILPGVLVLNGLEHAKRMAAIPGMIIPAEVFDRLARFEDLEDQRKESRDIAAGQVRRIRADGWSGIYVMSPASHEPLPEVLQAGLT